MTLKSMALESIALESMNLESITLELGKHLGFVILCLFLIKIANYIFKWFLYNAMTFGHFGRNTNVYLDFKEELKDEELCPSIANLEYYSNSEYLLLRFAECENKSNCKKNVLRILVDELPWVIKLKIITSIIYFSLIPKKDRPKIIINAESFAEKIKLLNRRKVQY